MCQLCPSSRYDRRRWGETYLGELAAIVVCCGVRLMLHAFSIVTRVVSGWVVLRSISGMHQLVSFWFLKGWEATLVRDMPE